MISLCCTKRDRAYRDELIVTYSELSSELSIPKNCNCISWSCQIDHLFSVMIAVKYGDRNNEFHCCLTSRFQFCSHGLVLFYTFSKWTRQRHAFTLEERAA